MTGGSKTRMRFLAHAKRRKPQRTVQRECRSVRRDRELNPSKRGVQGVRYFAK